MDATERRRGFDDAVARHGPWTAHNVHLGDGLYTMSPSPTGDEVKLRRVVQIVSDLLGGELAGARVLDLACLEGMYALELARRGARVTGIEGREQNLEKARFAARALGLDVDLRLGDVRSLSRREHGEFDVVLCLGILYHLDSPDVFELVERIGGVCRRALVVDTAVARGADETLVRDGYAYRAERLAEHDPASTADERRQALWSSLDNPSAVAFTRPSLETLLARTGFTSVYEAHVPAEPGKGPARVTVVALRGEPVGALLSPSPLEDPAEVPERPPLLARLELGTLWRAGRRAVPPPLRARLRRALGAETRRH
jgi:SAM-dependent methyltransferase